MDERLYGICFGLKDERIPELSEELQKADLPVSFWPSVSALLTSGLENLSSEQERVRLVALDCSYIEGCQDLVPLAGDSSALDERLTQVQNLFPRAQIILVTNRLATCARHVSWHEDCPQPSYITSYGLAQDAGLSGIATTFKRFLRD